MSRRTLVLDGLWYTLCPSFTPRGLSRPVSSLEPRKRSSRLSPPLRCQWPTATLPRYYSSHARGIEDSHAPGKHPTPSEPQDTPLSTSEAFPSPENQQHVNNSPKDARNSDTFRRQKAQPSARIPHSLENLSSSDLEAMLRNVMDKSPNIRATTQVLRALIRDRHIRPTARHYKALIIGHTDCERGSPEVVRQLLVEMEDNGIPADSGTLHAALQVLAVHPDFLLRQEVLRKLRDRWLTLSPAGWHFVVAGLLREHQFELALEQVAVMERKDIHIENWLHSTLIYHLCDFKEFDEVYRLMRARVEQGHDMTLALWSHVLTSASAAFHYSMTRYVWRRRVDLGYLHPSTEVCRNVLTIASRAGDVELANHVFRLSTDTQLPLDAKAYERLIETHLGAGDLPAVFHVLCVMHEAGLAIEDTATQPVIDYMGQQRVDPRAAWQMLKHLKNAKRAIPIDSIHLIARFCEVEAQHDPSVADDAIGFYKDLHTLLPDGADVLFYNSLVRTCRRAGNRAAGMFLVKEMASLGVAPDGATFDALILMCLDARNYQSAYMYFQDLLKQEKSVSKETLAEIRELCAQSVDEFALRLQYHPGVQGSEVGAFGENQLPQTQRELLQQVTETRGRKGGHVMPPAVRRQLISPEKRIAWNKKRRQKKRRLEAISRLMDGQGIDTESLRRSPTSNGRRSRDEIGSDES